MSDQNRFRKISIILFILMLVALAVHMESIVRFNEQEIKVHGNDTSADVRMEIDARQDSTSTWLKRSFPLSETELVDLTGQTIDGEIRNSGEATIQDWELRINIRGNCFINQAWNGEVEIHQFVGTEKEKTQRMNLQNYQLPDVTLEYRYDGDLLIPLQQGDYILYFPNERFSEMPIAAGEDAKIGMIFYYLDTVDLSDYDLRYHHHRDFTQGITFWPYIILSVLWLLAALMTAALTLSYRKARKEMELRKAGVFSMSDMYDAIYLIHLPTGEMTPVSVDDKVERLRPKNQKARDYLSGIAREDAEDNYRDMITEFVDTDTLPERLKDRDSIVSEFRSRTYGWCSIRFFAMNRVENEPVTDVVFAVQVINEEKKELEAMTAQIEHAESVSKSRSVFMENIVHDLQMPLEELLGRIERIRNESRDAKVHGYAREAYGIASRLLLLTEGLVDSSDMQASKMEMTAEAYSLRRLLIGTLQDVLPLAETHHVTMALDVAETLPDHLRGDARLLQEVLVNLVSCLIPAAEGGRMQLAIYGKLLDEKIHLLFSVRSFFPPRGASDPDRASADSGDAAGPKNLNMEVATSLLTGMGSALRSVRSPADRSEYYFETEQQVLDPGPIGAISAEDAALD